jgi:hypothetical protein
MKNLTEFRLYVWTDGNENRARLDFKVKPEAQKPQYLNGERSKIAPMTDCSMYFVQSLFVDFCKGTLTSYSDLNRHLYDDGTCVTFYEMDLLSIQKNNGVLEVPFFKAFMPIRVRKILLRMCEKLWAKDREAAKTNQYRDRIRVDISEEKLARWEKMYRCGSGQVITILGGDYEATKAAVCEQHKDASLKKNIDRLQTIAQNQTFSPYQTGFVYLAKRANSKEFWFEVQRRVRKPNGERVNSRTSCGGLVYHTHAQEWATHT